MEQNNTRPLKLLLHSEFRSLIFGRFFTIMAFRMLATLLGWWIYQLTKDPLAIGLIGLSEVIPALGTALYAGHIVDKSEKRSLLLIFISIYIFLISILFLVAHQHISWGISSKEIPIIIYSIIFITGFCRAFLGPIIPSMIPKVVGKENIAPALVVNQAAFLLSSVTGHAVGGLLIDIIGLEKTLLCIITLLFISGIFYLQLNKQHSVAKVNEKTIDSMLEGMRYIFQTPEILGALCLDLFAVLFGGAVAMIPVFASSILQVGGKGFGLLNAATDIGAIITVILLALFPIKSHQGWILLGAVAGFGVCIIGFGLSTWFWVSFAFLVISGMLDGVSVVIRHTIVQLSTPDEIRGRVTSANSMFITSSNELGQFESGVASRLFGIVPSVVIGGSLTLIVALIVGIKAPKLRKMSY